MTYRYISAEDQAQILERRITTLEREHYDNAMALSSAESRLVSSEEEDELKASEVKRLKDNLSIISSSLEALGSSSPAISVAGGPSSTDRIAALESAVDELILTLLFS